MANNIIKHIFVINKYKQYSQITEDAMSQNGTIDILYNY